MGENKEEKKQKKQSKKELKKQQEEQLEQKQEEEIDKLLKMLEENIGTQEAKIVKIRTPRPNSLSYWKEVLIILLLNVFIIIGINGIFSIADWSNIFKLLFFSLYFSGIEIILQMIILIAFPKLIIKTYGLITLLPSLVSMIISTIFPIFITIRSVPLFIIALVFTIIIRQIIRHFILSIQYRRKMGGKKWLKK